MIKKLLLSAAMFSVICANAQSFSVTYDFAAITASTGVTDPTPTPTVTGITCGSFVAVGTPNSNSSAGGRFSFDGWPAGATNGASTYTSMTGAINPAQYYEVTLTPASGHTVNLNTIGFKVQRSGTGIRSYAVRSSADSYGANLTATVISNPNVVVAGSNEFFILPDASAFYLGSLIDLSSTFTFTSATSFRFYGWNSEGTGGTFSIDDVIFSGNVTGGAACVSPTITSITGLAVICTPTLNFAASVVGDSPLTYTWTGVGVFSTPNSASTSITGAMTGDYTLTVSNACGTATSVATAIVNPPFPVVSLALNDTLQCASASTVALSGGSPSNGVYSGIGVTGGVFNPALAGIGSHTITYTYTDVCGVVGIDTDVIIVSSCGACISPTVTTITGLAVICTPTLNFAASVVGDSPLTYTWTGVGVFSTPNAASTSITGAMTGDYTLTVSNACGTATSVASAVVYPPFPVVSLALTSTLQCASASTVALSGGSPSNGVYSGTGVTGGVFNPALAGIGSHTITYTYTDVCGVVGTDTDVIIVSACTGIQSLTAETLHIYPNPSSGLVLVKTPILNVQLNVFDMNGKKIFTQATSSFETQIDLSNFANGIYQLNIVSENQSFNHKLMINK